MQQRVVDLFHFLWQPAYDAWSCGWGACQACQSRHNHPPPRRSRPRRGPLQRVVCRHGEWVRSVSERVVTAECRDGKWAGSEHHAHACAWLHVPLPSLCIGRRCSSMSPSLCPLYLTINSSIPPNPPPACPLSLCLLSPGEGGTGERPCWRGSPTLLVLGICLFGCVGWGGCRRKGVRRNGFI